MLVLSFPRYFRSLMNWPRLFQRFGLQPTHLPKREKKGKNAGRRFNAHFKIQGTPTNGIGKDIQEIEINTFLYPELEGNFSAYNSGAVQNFF